MAIENTKRRKEVRNFVALGFLGDFSFIFLLNVFVFFFFGLFIPFFFLLIYFLIYLFCWLLNKFSVGFVENFSFNVFVFFFSVSFFIFYFPVDLFIFFFFSFGYQIKRREKKYEVLFSSLLDSWGIFLLVSFIFYSLPFYLLY